MAIVADDCVIPSTVIVEPGASVGPRVVFVGGKAIVRARATVEAAVVIGADVTIGQGALVRPGSVVLRSVPPNAIVEGNPAQIVGYRDTAERGSHRDIAIRDASVFTGMSAPASLQLGIGRSALHLMRRVVDPRGMLTVGEFGSELPFEPRRYFLVYNVPSKELRGEHAHRQCHQFLICVNGSCHVLLDDGAKRCEVILDRRDVAVYMPPMIWGTQYRYSNDTILMVFASHHYDADDYLRTYDEFLAEVARGI